MWQQKLSGCITSIDELLQITQLTKEQLNISLDAHQQFSLQIPRDFAEKIEKGNPNDPLLLQALPIAEEMQKVQGFNADPVGDLAANPVPGLLHKYHGRVLFTLTGKCAINCRYCSRRHFPYAEHNPGRKGWQPALQYIQNDNKIQEVILSGGDPLIAPDNLIAELVAELEKIPHLTTLRIHTRLPVTIPERLTNELIKILTESRLNPVIVIHCNHPNEIDKTAENYLLKLKNAGITTLNQSVLLALINTQAPILAQLSNRLFDCGVLPYYLHMLDYVDGAAHFQITENEAQRIMNELLTLLPGYLVPRLVCEQAGAMSKTPIATCTASNPV